MKISPSQAVKVFCERRIRQDKQPVSLHDRRLRERIRYLENELAEAKQWVLEMYMQIKVCNRA